MRIPLFASLLLLALPLSAAEPKPVNLGFEQGVAGWALRSGDDYEAMLSTAARSGSTGIKVRSLVDKPRMFANAMQIVDAAPYRGKFVRVRAWIRCEANSPDAGAHIWLRVDRPNKQQGFFDNTMDRPIRNPEWREYDVVGDVADDAEFILFGAYFQGVGTMWADDFSFELADAAMTERPPASAPAQAYLEKAIAIMETNSVRRDKVNWPDLRERASLVARGAAAPSDTYMAIRFALRQLGDHHSFFLQPGAAKQWSGAGASEPIPEVKLIEGNIGYIAVPGYNGSDPKAADAYVEAVQAKIASVDPSARCGWIVDLRKNPGGNVWPMLSGLGPILGEGELMSMKGPAASNVVVYARGRALDKRAIDQLPQRQAYAPAIAPAVAVLTSPMTASSGEGVTIAFRGRPRTRSFGAPTAGVSTGNAQFKLEDGALIFLTTSVMIDRNGKEYGEAVRPDVEVQGDAETQAAATQWLRNESGCSK